MADDVCFVIATSLTLWSCWMVKRCRGPWPILSPTPKLPKACCWTTSRKQDSLSTWTPGHGTLPSTMMGATWSRCYSTALRLVRTVIDSFLSHLLCILQHTVDFHCVYLVFFALLSFLFSHLLHKTKLEMLPRLILTRVTCVGNLCCLRREFGMAGEIPYKGEDSSSNNDRAC